jgi:hypothetical protein
MHARCDPMSKYKTDREGIFDGAFYIKAQSEPSEYSLFDPLPLFRRGFFIDGEIECAEIFVKPDKEDESDGDKEENE